MFFYLLSLLCLALDVPTLTGRVVDQAGLLGAQDAALLVSQLETLESKAQIQAAVLTVESLEGSDIESYSLRVAEAWKLGKKGSDRGLLLVVAAKDRRMRWEVGYGLEGDITDAFSKRLIVENLAPYFKQGQYGAGILSAFSRIGEKFGVEPMADSGSGFENVTPPENSRWFKFLQEFGFLLVLIPIVLLQALIPRRWRGTGGYRSSGWSGGGGGWSSSSGGGGGFSGGGGSFGGGGSSGSW